MKKAIIVGASSVLDLSFLNEKDSYFVASDGGYKYFLKEKKEPDLLVGDFDTLDKNLIKNPKEIIKLNPIKDDTDTFFILKKLIKDGFDEFHLYGCLGNKEDHSIANIELLYYLAKKKKRGFLYLNDKVLFSSYSDVSFLKEAKGMISIFSLSTTSKISISNLKYNLDNKTIYSYIPLGISNEFINTSSSIKVKRGVILIDIDKDNLKYLSFN